MSTLDYTQKLSLTDSKGFYTWVGIGLVLLLTIVTSFASEFNFIEALDVLPGVFGFITEDFLPPAYEALPNLVSPLLDTFFMAVVATITGALLSIILALLAATPTSPSPVFQVMIRSFVSFLRNIPSLAWALILVPAFGIGKFVGLLALFIGSLGTMTRFFTESIEEIDLGGLEAMRSVGGSYWQSLKSGVIPQVLPSLISWTLYSLELNIRASTIIGMVGGGGIGLYIQSTVKLFRYDHTAMAIVAVAISILLLEFISKKIREAIL